VLRGGATATARDHQVVIDFDALPDAVVRVDAQRRIVDANAAAARLIGCRLDGLLGRELVHAFAPRGTNGQPLLVGGWHPSAGLRSVRGIPEQDVTIATANGDETVRVTGKYERDGEGSVTGAVIVLRPPRTHSEPTGGDVVSMVSHELRTPLTSIKGFTSLLLSKWDRLEDEQKRMMLEQVHQDADRVTRLMTDLLDTSRLESGRLLLRRQWVNLARLTQGVVEKLTVTYPDLDCQSMFPEEFPQVSADPDKLEQVLTNLVENAAKHGSTAGMAVAGEVVDHAVAVAVIDAGKGITASDLPRVFDKLFRCDRNAPTGAGLGLWISRRLVQAHGGRLTAASEPGKGSVFRFTLPIGGDCTAGSPPTELPPHPA
jgi:signal transduction histidine kinase